jgi:hypothetical protein
LTTILLVLQLHHYVPVLAWSSTASNVHVPTVSRRESLASAVAGLSWVASVPTVVSATEEQTSNESATPTEYRFESRDRKSNKDAIVREDFWYMLGKTPPRSLQGPLKLDGKYHGTNSLIFETNR